MTSALQSQAVGDIGISAIPLDELRYGVEKSRAAEKNRRALDATAKHRDDIAMRPTESRRVYCATSSTRRFLARPSSVRFEAIGTSGPTPKA